MTVEVQALWFRTDTWLEDDAAQWCDEHNFQSDVVRVRVGDDGLPTHVIFPQFEPPEDTDWVTLADDFPDGVSASAIVERDSKHMEPQIKTGTQSASDPFTFILSDETVDRDGDIIKASGWQLKDFNANPVALFGHDHAKPIGTWEDVRVVGKQLLGSLVLAAKGTSAEIDTIRSLIEQRILKAVSVGFAPLEYEERLDAKGKWTGGFTFVKTGLLEGSIVSVPSNPAALITAKAVAKAMGAAPDLIGDQTDEGSHARAREVLKDGLTSAQPGLTQPDPVTQTRKGTPMTTIAMRLAEAEAEKSAILDRKAALQSKVESEADYELTDDDIQELDNIETGLAAAEKAIAGFKRFEDDVKSRAKPVDASAPAPARAAKKEAAGELLIKNIVASLVANFTEVPISEVRREWYGDDERVMKAGRQFSINKSAVDAADTTTPGWAAELVRTDYRAFMEELRATSVLAKLSAMPGASLLSFDGYNSVTTSRRDVSSQSSGAATAMAAMANLGSQMGGAFVGEGGVIPVKSGAVSALVINRSKLAVISAFTGELMEQSRPNIEAIVRAQISEDTALAQDGGLLDGVAAVAGVRPASVFNGAASQASAGATAAGIISDLKFLLGSLSAINGAQPVLILNSNRLLGLSTVTTAAGGFMFADDIRQGRLLGVPFIASTTVNPSAVGIIDASSFTAATDTPRFAVSDQATLTMANADGTAPTQAGAATDHTGGAVGTAEEVPADGGIVVTGNGSGAPSGASVAGYGAQSLWQQYQTAVRMILPTAWAMTRPNSTAYVTGVTW